MEIFEKILRLIADLMTIFGIGGMLTWGLSKWNKTVWGYRFFLFAIYCLRFAAIAIFGVISFGIFSIIYIFSLDLLKGNVNYYYWEKGNEIPYLLSYLFAFSISFPIFILSSLAIATSSLYYFKLCISKLTSNGKIISPIEIIEASYGSTLNKYDVTSKLKSMVKAGRLKAVASNNINGDPDVGVRKILKVKYRTNFGEQVVEIMEDQTLDIP